MSNWFRRLRARIRYRRFHDDVARELEVHRAMKQAELESSGVPPAAARRQSAREMGNATLARERARGVWIAPWLQSVWQDIRYALNTLRRQPLFGLSAILVLAVGSGLVTALFSFTHAVLLRPWQVPDAASMAQIRPRVAPGSDFAGISVPEFRYLKDHARSFAHIFVSVRSNARVTYAGGDTESLQAMFVSGNYFEALQIGMAAGRAFTPAEDDYKTPHAVAIISERLWRERFGRDPAIIGRSVRINNQPHAIVGVAARGFLDPHGTWFEVWRPLTATILGQPPSAAAGFTDPRLPRSPTMAFAGRMRPGMSHAAAEADLTAVSQQFRLAAGLPAIGVRLQDTRRISGSGNQEEQQVLALVFVALILVQLLACANVGNLLLARALSRQREIAVRLSLGASRARLVRQLLTEAGVLTVAAAAAGSALAFALPSLVFRLFGREWERPEYFAPGPPVFWFAFGLAAITAVLCGLAPALRGTRLSLASVAGERQGQTVRSARLRATLLAVQMALATVLLAAAGLLTRAVAHGSTLDPGFPIAEIQAITARFPPGAQRPQREAFYRGLEDSLNGTGRPLIALSNTPPLADSNHGFFARLDPKGRVSVLPVRPISPGYFEVLGIRIIAGRAVSHAGRAVEVVLSRAAAHRLWPGQDPLGRTILQGVQTSELRPRVVVGVAEDVAVSGPGQIEPVVYTSTAYFSAQLLVRDQSAAVFERIRAAAAAVDASVTLTTRPLTDNIRESMTIAIIGSRVAWAIGMLGLVLASVGAFGVFAYAVEERRREIGIRMALGAGASQVVRFVLARAQRSVLIGLGAGIALSLIAAPLLRSYLYGLSPFDPVAYAQIAAILGAAAALATWIPARRATRVDPAITLRCD